MPHVKKLNVLPNTTLELSFTRKSEHKISDEANHCNEDSTYSLTKCLSNFVSNSVGCRMFWNEFTLLKPCSTKADIIRTQDWLEWIKTSSMDNISTISGCLLKCTETTYKLSVVSKEQISWDTNWISDVYIVAESDAEEVENEYYAYDSGDLLGDLGGFLGLFLGGSFLSMFLSIPTLWRFIVTNAPEKLLK